jgi:outer membrane receptor protein involved in Fe transport
MFPASVFPLPVLGTDGTLGPSTFRGPGFAQVDMSLSKKFAITEALSLQLRFDAYNAFNRVNLDAPVVDLASSSFGRSTSQQTPRSFQVGARIRF